MRFSSFVSSAPAASLSLRSAAVVGLVLASSSSSVLAQDRTTEKGEAQITDPTQECAVYSYPPVVAAKANFPTIWQIADILPGDSAANAEWNAIKPSVPANIQVKGTPLGDFSNFTPSYPHTDPDCWWSYSKCTTPKDSNLTADTTILPEPMSYGLGFDDGPNCSHNAFYDFLASQNQKASMYYIGSNVMDWPLEAQRGLADGHEICVHTWSHRYMTALTSTQAFAELYYTREAIKLVLGITPTCWRPPYGDVDDRIRAIAAGVGLRTTLWEFDSNDWKAGIGNVTAATVDQNYENVIASAQNGTFATRGTIMLTHELNNFTMSEMIKMYPKLKAAFKYLVPIGIGYNITQPYIQTNYSLPTFSQYIGGQTTSPGSAPGAVGASTAGVSAGSDGKLTPRPSSANAPPASNGGTSSGGSSGGSSSNTSSGSSGHSAASTVSVSSFAVGTLALVGGLFAFLA